MADKTRFFIEGTMRFWLSILMPILEKEGRTFRIVKNREGEVVSYSVLDELNLKITITHKGLTIDNSLHKAFNKLNGVEGNHNYFGYKELYQILNYLSLKYQFNLKDAFIKKIELGVNVEVDKPSMDYINKMYSLSYTKPCDLMRNRNVVYGKKIFLSQYSIKLYDKSHQHYNQNGTRLDKQIIRYELEYNKMTSLKKYVVTLADLLDVDKYIGLTDLLSLKFSGLQFKEGYNIDMLTCKPLEQYYAGLDYKFWKDLSKRNKSTLATRKRRFNHLIEVIQNYQDNKDSLSLELRNKIRRAIYELV